MNYFSEFLTGYVHVTEKYDYRSPNNVKSITLNLQQYNLFAKKLPYYYVIHILEFPDFSKTLKFQNGKLNESLKVQNIICLDKDEKRKNKANPLPPPPKLPSVLPYLHTFKIKTEFHLKSCKSFNKINVFVNSFIALLLK